MQSYQVMASTGQHTNTNNNVNYPPGSYYQPQMSQHGMLQYPYGGQYVTVTGQKQTGQMLQNHNQSMGLVQQHQKMGEPTMIASTSSNSMKMQGNTSAGSNRIDARFGREALVFPIQEKEMSYLML